MFMGKTRNFHSASLHPGVQSVPPTCQGSLMIDWRVFLRENGIPIPAGGGSCTNPSRFMLWLDYVLGLTLNCVISCPSFTSVIDSAGRHS